MRIRRWIPKAVRAPNERLDQGSGDVMEQWTYDAFEQSTCQLIVEHQAHLASIILQGGKRPKSIESLERSIDQPQFDRKIIERPVARREPLADPAKVDLKRRLELVQADRTGFGGAAPRQKERVCVDVGDQGVHSARRMQHQGSSFNMNHGWTGGLDDGCTRSRDGYNCRTYPRQSPMSIVENRKATHDYFIEERLEAGIVLEGWEAKAIRAGRAQLKEAYVIVSAGELFLIGAHVSPLATASTHVNPDPTRTRKLLMHAAEIEKLIGKVERAGYALVPLDLHYTGGRIKLQVGLAKGKRQFDKRQVEKEREWVREKQRLLRHQTR